ncbi:MAG TPA: methyltransferase domain-containing protein [Chloroflexota bacterium]|nr:methyltransferase domain-containing protein [Chloroflexota bacterium]
MSDAGPGRSWEWDAITYDRIAHPMTRWGQDVLARLELAGHETVLDAGCGSGRVTEALLDRLPRGQVIALDRSPGMLVQAARRLAGKRVWFLCADLARPLPLSCRVDAVLSTATFHWIADHEALFRHLAAVLRPGGQLVAQCGGAGNIASVVEALRHTGDGWAGPWTFATPDETRHRLQAAGFEDIQVWLHAEPTPFEPGEPLETYLATVVLGAHLDRLPPAERPPLVKAVAARLPRPEIDYVRLNIIARRE